MGKLLKAEEVRAMLDLGNVATVYRWARDGKLPAVVLGRKTVRFREEDVAAFVQSKATGQPA